MTTEKDYMRLGTLATQFGIGHVRISCGIEDGQGVIETLVSMLPQA